MKENLWKRKTIGNSPLKGDTKSRKRTEKEKGDSALFPWGEGDSSQEGTGQIAGNDKDVERAVRV